MPEARLTLSPLDWGLIGGYLAVALAIAIAVRQRAGRDRVSFFLAGRSLPWWVAGTSIAATTFAADTPLAITGIVARRGLSGNWMWFAWIGVHAAVVVYYARCWRRSEVLTDAELVALRYSGPLVPWLRSFRAGLAGVVINCVVLGWVLRAMVKIVTPYFHWKEWLPGPLAALERVWPAGTALGSASEGVTIILLLAIVGLYSSLGGIRGVALTDLLQFTLAMTGSIWLSVVVWRRVGGRSGLGNGLRELYGEGDQTLSFLPSFEHGWLAALGLGFFTFACYLMVQSFSNAPADGGGYMMQRLGSTRSGREAQKAAMLFLGFHYLVRVWPWFVVALAALVLIPIGGEATVFGGAAAMVADDRELAYPVLMGVLLPPAVLGLMVTSLLAAFMSTVDTHLNWGASYIVNDIYVRLRPAASDRQQVRVARLCVGGFTALAVLVSLRIETIEQAYQWVAALGASAGLPTALRWLWWRVNAAGELCAMGVGLLTALILTRTDLVYEQRLPLIAAASLVGLAAGMVCGAPTERAHLERFAQRVRPWGVWPTDLSPGAGRQAAAAFGRWLALAFGTLGLLGSLSFWLLRGPAIPAFLALAAFLALWLWGGRPRAAGPEA